MTKEEMIALLGRPLTPVENTNFDKYLKIASQNLDTLLCTRLCDKEDPRVYDVREGYRTVFIDIFTDINEVKVDGKEVTTFSKRQWDRRSGKWFNALVFEDRFSDCDKEIEVSATWGFSKGMPSDLQSLLSGLFDQIGKKNKYNPTVKSKEVEDFKVTFNTDVDLDDQFYTRFGNTINKYSLCAAKESYVLHGDTC